MINLTQLKYYRESFEYLAQQPNFPEKLTFHPNTFEEAIHPSYPGYADLMKYRKIIYQFTLSEIKAIYTDTFDFNKTSPLCMAYSKFDTQRERGQMLARLKVLYEMFGLKMVDNKLSDYLPLMLQFLHVASWHDGPRVEGNVELVIMIIEDGTYEMANQLAKENNPYVYVIRVLRETLKAYLDIPKGVTHHA